jgi:membrane protease YdiL (CAAX protease family)
MTQPQDVLPMVTLGVVLGYIRLRYRSLPACVLVHMLFNARTMIIATLAPELITADSPPAS